jgi:hypothetical protein
VYEFPKAADIEDDEIGFNVTKIPSFMVLNQKGSLYEILIDNIKEEGEYKIKVSLQDLFGSNNYEFYIIFKMEIPPFIPPNIIDYFKIVREDSTKC